jgi:hypothetical protein
VDIYNIVTELKAERDRLSQAIAALEGVGTALSRTNRSVTRRAKSRKRRGLTPAGRKRLSEAMKKRWAERRKKGA